MWILLRLAPLAEDKRPWRMSAAALNAQFQLSERIAIVPGAAWNFTIRLPML